MAVGIQGDGRRASRGILSWLHLLYRKFSGLIQVYVTGSTVSLLPRWPAAAAPLSLSLFRPDERGGTVAGARAGLLS